MERNDKGKDMSIYEASDFWDEHDFGEFDDVREVQDIKFSLRKKKYVGIDKDLYSIIKSKAKALNKSEDTPATKHGRTSPPQTWRVNCNCSIPTSGIPKSTINITLNHIKLKT